MISSAGFCCSYWWLCGGCDWPGTWSGSPRARAKTRATRLCCAAISPRASCCARSSSSRPPLPGSSHCHCRFRRFSDRRRRCCGPFLIAGVAIWGGRRVLRGGRRPPAAPVQGRSRQQGRGDGSRPVGLDASSQLFRRRLRWWGLWLASIAGWISLVTVLSPALMTYFLVYATGARLLEQHMKDRPGFREYCSRTSFFIPTTAQIANIVTILAAVARLPLVTTDLARAVAPGGPTGRRRIRHLL